MAEYIAYADYVIAFRDEADYNAAKAAVGGPIVYKNPHFMADYFGITWPVGGSIDTASKFMYVPSGAGNYSLSEPGTQVNHPLASGVFLSPSVDYVIVPGQAGNPASIWPAGPDMKLIWSGTLVLWAAGAGEVGSGGPPASNPQIAPIPQRRFGSGFDLLETLAAPYASAGLSRSASRTSDGLGIALRHDTGFIWTQLLAAYNPGFTSYDSWERFYIRLPVLPNIEVQIHKTNASSSTEFGQAIRVSAAGEIKVYSKTNSSPSGGTLKATSSPLVLNKWYKIDTIVKYNPAGSGGTGRGRVWINGVLLIDYSATPGEGGLGINNNTHISSTLGAPDMGAWTGEIDLDDWHNAEIPKITGVEALTSLDWLGGTHWRKSWNTAFGSQHSVNWAGQFEGLNSMMSPINQPVDASLTSSTSGARIDGVMDVDNNQDFVGTRVGVAAAVVTINNFRAGVANGQLGYRLADGAAVLTNITESTSAIFNSVMYRPTLGVIPDNIVPFHVIHDKGASASLDTVRGMQASVQYVGVFGPEDDPTNTDTGIVPFYHNAYYPNTIWAFTGPVPDAPMAVVGGTYVGNGTINNINLPIPAHLICIRATTGAYAGGIKWWSAALGAVDGVDPTTQPNEIVRCWVDGTGQAKFTTVGSNQFCNAVGVTYQYIAFCDPGMRYMINSSFRHNSTIANFANPLADSGFIPECVFAVSNVVNNTVSVNGTAYKGPGHTGTVGTFIDGTSIANFGSYVAGIFNSGAGLHTVSATTQAYSAIRSNDGNGVMVQPLSYVGNGAGGTRSITLTPTSGRWPLLAIVIPSNSQARFRDPTHTGSSSQTWVTDVTETTAIVGGGIDRLDVGVLLNANGIVYNVFVIPGDTAGWNNGTFFPPNQRAPGTQWFTPPDEFGDIIMIGAGGIVLSGAPALTLLKSISGIYAIIPGQRHDVLLDRQTSQTSVNVPIPNPFAKSGFLGG